MQSLTEEIQSFSRTRLRKQCTRVTSLSGRRIIETWKGSTITVVEDPAPPEKTLGYVPDTSWDLQVGVVKPYLLLGSQDAAHDFATLRKHKVSHILNVAFGVENVFPDLFIYKTVSILDHPDADLLLHIQDCCHFVQQARREQLKSSMILHLDLDSESTRYWKEAFHRCFSENICLLLRPKTRVLSVNQSNKAVKGVVLVHCNAGVSRAPAVVIGYLMSCDGQSFDDALSLVQAARSASSPNPGFLDQLRGYKMPTMNGSTH